MQHCCTVLVRKISLPVQYVEQRLQNDIAPSICWRKHVQYCCVLVQYDAARSIRWRKARFKMVPAPPVQYAVTWRYDSAIAFGLRHSRCVRGRIHISLMYNGTWHTCRGTSTCREETFEFASVAYLNFRSRAPCHRVRPKKPGSRTDRRDRAALLAPP